MSICAPQYATPSEKSAEPLLHPCVPAILPGTVCAQYVRCGKPKCICRTGKAHGPYYYRVWRADGAVQKVYVRPEDVPAVMEACAAYGQFSRALRLLRRERQMLTDKLEKDVRRSKRITERHSFLPPARQRSTGR